MKRKKAARLPQAHSDTTQESGNNLFAPSRRSFLRTAAGRRTGFGQSRPLRFRRPSWPS